MALDLAFAETVRRRGILRTNILVMDEVLYVCMYACMYVCMHLLHVCVFVHYILNFRYIECMCVYLEFLKYMILSDNLYIHTYINSRC
jgi:hypothetical protein